MRCIRVIDAIIGFRLLIVEELIIMQCTMNKNKTVHFEAKKTDHFIRTNSSKWLVTFRSGATSASAGRWITRPYARKIHLNWMSPSHAKTVESSAVLIVHRNHPPAWPPDALIWKLSSHFNSAKSKYCYSISHTQTKGHRSHLHSY